MLCGFGLWFCLGELLFLVEFMEGEGDLLIFLFFLFIEEFVDDMLLFVLLFEF